MGTLSGVGGGVGGFNAHNNKDLIRPILYPPRNPYELISFSLAWS